MKSIAKYVENDSVVNGVRVMMLKSFAPRKSEVFAVSKASVANLGHKALSVGKKGSFVGYSVH